MATLSSPTAQDLISSVRRRLGERQASNSRWTDEAIVEYLNNAVSRYFGEVIQNSEGLFQKRTTLSTVAGTATIALPTDFFEIVAVKKKEGDAYIPLVYDTGREDIDDDASNGGSGFYRPSYYINGTDLVLNPVPSSTEADAFRLEYVHFPDQMVYGGDSLTSEVAPVFKDLIISYAAYEAKVDENVRTNGGAAGGLGAAKAHLDLIYSQFREVIRERSHATDFTRPWGG